jgi:LacI family transcriptional regulator
VDHSPHDILLNTIQVDGVLIIGLRSINDPLLSLVKQLRVPYMALGRYWPGAEFSCIGINDRQALVAMVEYLAGLGHRHLALMSEQRVETFMWHQLRLAGFDEGLQRCGLDRCRERVVVAASPEAGVAEILARWPHTSAIVATHDNLAYDVIQALAEQGRAVPDHISVVGYDNIGGLDQRLGDNYFPPNITSIDSRQVEAGRIGADSMLRWIREPEVQHMQITLQWRLVERGSTRPVAATA